MALCLVEGGAGASQGQREGLARGGAGSAPSPFQDTCQGKELMVGWPPNMEGPQEEGCRSEWQADASALAPEQVSPPIRDVRTLHKGWCWEIPVGPTSQGPQERAGGSGSEEQVATEQRLKVEVGSSKSGKGREEFSSWF